MSLKKLRSFWVWAATEHANGPLHEDQIIELAQEINFRRVGITYRKRSTKDTENRIITVA